MASYLQEDNENQQGQGSGTNTQSNDKLVTAASPNSGLGGGAPQTIAPKNKTTKFVNLQKFIDSNSNTIKDIPTTLTGGIRSTVGNTSLDTSGVHSETRATPPTNYGPNYNSIYTNPTQDIKYATQEKTTPEETEAYKNYLKTLQGQKDLIVGDSVNLGFDNESDALDSAVKYAKNQANKLGISYTPGMGSLDQLIFGMKKKDIADAGNEIIKTIDGKIVSGKKTAEDIIKENERIKNSINTSIKDKQIAGANNEIEKLKKLQKPAQTPATKEVLEREAKIKALENFKTKNPQFKGFNGKSLEEQLSMMDQFFKTKTGYSSSQVYTPEQIAYIKKLESILGNNDLINEDQIYYQNPEYFIHDNDFFNWWNTTYPAPPPVTPGNAGTLIIDPNAGNSRPTPTPPSSSPPPPIGSPGQILIDPNAFNTPTYNWDIGDLDIGLDFGNSLSGGLGNLYTGIFGF